MTLFETTFIKSFPAMIPRTVSLIQKHHQFTLSLKPGMNLMMPLL